MGASLAEVKARVSEALDPGKLGLNQKPLAFVNVIRLGACGRLGLWTHPGHLRCSSLHMVTYVSMYVCMYVRMHASVYVYIYIYIHIYVYMYIEKEMCVYASVYVYVYVIA